MKAKMKVRVVDRNPNFQGVVELPNLATTYLRKENGSTEYATVANLRRAATVVAKKYNVTLDFEAPSKVAAKKTV